jgi:hypothetical protein
MGVLYDMCQVVLKELEARNPNPVELLLAKGEMARRAGFMVSLVAPSDADDPAKIESLRAAARQAGIDV